MKTTKGKLGTIICKNSSFFVTSLRAPTDLTIPAQPLGPVPSCPGPRFSPLRPPVPPPAMLQHCQSPAPHSPTTWSGLSLFPGVCPMLGVAADPQLPCSWARTAGQALATNPCPAASRGDPTGWVPREQPLLCPNVCLLLGYLVSELASGKIR